MKSVTLEIEGMRCAGCSETLEAALERERGIRAASVSFQSGRARLLLDPEVVEERHLVDVVERAGYRVRRRGQSSSPPSA